jgi:hypothetical protein
LEQLQYEKDHAGEIEQLEKDKAQAVTDLTNTYNTNLENAEAEHNRVIIDLTTNQTLELERLENERKNKIETIERQTNSMVEYLNRERNTTVSKIRVEQQTIEQNHQTKLAEIVLAGEQKQLQIIADAEAEKQQIIAESQAKIEGFQSGTSSLAVPTTSLPEVMWSNRIIPALADGGVVDSPTVALIGESGPEAVVPLAAMGGFGVASDGGVQININAPLVTVQGSADRATIEAAKNEVYRMLQSVVIETGDSTSRIRVKSTNTMNPINTR